VRGELDLLVLPLRGAVLARDETHAVHPPEIPVDERVTRLGLVVGVVGECKVPLRVLVPGVGLQKGVLVGGLGLRVAPVALDDVLMRVDSFRAWATAGLFTE
jgi:hypothetical protein